MNTIRMICFAGMTGLVATLAVFAQDKREDISQGFRAYVIAEPRYKEADVRDPIGNKDKPGRNPVDLVTENGLNPVIAVFSRAIPADASHPLAALVKKLDELSDPDPKVGYGNRRLATYIVFLALKDEFRKDPTFDNRVKEVSQYAAGVMSKRVTFALAEATETPDGTEQPLVPAQVTAMGITPEDDLVIVFYNNLQVVKRWKFKAAKPPTEEDLKAIDEEVVKVLGPRKK